MLDYTPDNRPCDSSGPMYQPDPGMADLHASLPPLPAPSGPDSSAEFAALIPARTFDARVSERLATLSPEETLQLDEFFRGIFKLELAGYTLFFDKPSAWIGIGLIVLQDDGWHFEPVFEETKVRGLEILKNSFAGLNRNFALLSSISEHFGGQNIFLIDREACLVQIQENLDIFQDIFGPNLTPGEVLLQIEAGAGSPLQMLRNSHCALGILLGFGRADSVEFQRMMEMSDRSDVDPGAMAEYRRLFDSKQGLFDRCSDTAIIDLLAASPRCHLLNYATWKSESEVQALRMKYAAEKAAIDRIAGLPDFLERVLERLCR